MSENGKAHRAHQIGGLPNGNGNKSHISGSGTSKGPTTTSKGSNSIGSSAGPDIDSDNEIDIAHSDTNLSGPVSSHVDTSDVPEGPSTEADDVVTPLPRKKAKRTKTFTGCYTCRRRKVSCDGARPTCMRCRKSRYVCEGYDIKLNWSQPVQYDKYAQALPTKPYNHDPSEVNQRRQIDFVRYSGRDEYHYYSEMNNDLNQLHRADVPNPRSPTIIKGHFGVFRGATSKKRHVRRPGVRRKSSTTDITPSNSLSLPSRNAYYPSTPAIAAAGFESQEKIGNEWLSNELLDAALLTASAINGDTHFLDMFKTDDLVSVTSLDQPALKPAEEDTDNMLHLLFQGQKPKESQQLQQQQQQQSQLQLQPQPYQQVQETLFSRTDKQISNNTLQINAGNGANMPKTIMEVLETMPLPKSLAIDKFGIPTTSLNVLPTTRYLLNYYIEDVADMMTVIPLPKNPWKFIYFPRAIMAVGELASLGKTSSARNALVNALLAVSAFNLQSKFERGSDEMKFYVNLGIQLRQQATNFLSECLQEDILNQKYKDVLVAVLSMVTIDVAWGTMSACKIHLDHCEKIIEKKMSVKKRLSPKAVILHRIFSCLKLIQDSTCIDNISKDDIFLTEKNYRRFLTGAEPTPEQIEDFFDTHFRDMFRGSRLRQLLAENARNETSKGRIFGAFAEVTSPEAAAKKGTYNESIADNGKVRIEYIVNVDDEAPKTVKSDDGIPAFIDITRASFLPSKNKLDDKMVSSDAIWGLPNSLILMFSEVVHLTKFKRYHSENKLPVPSFFDELALQLEFKLLTWKLEWKLTEEDDAKNPKKNNEDNSDGEVQQFISPRHEGIYHHVMSFYYGLMIYFYRFVEDVDPLYLQDRIEKVLHHLNAIQDILEQHPETSYIIPLFWQGFIAGSEAITIYLQNGFNIWGQHIARTGVGSYWNSRQIMLEIWRRKNHNVKNSSWVDVLRDWKTNVMLT